MLPAAPVPGCHRRETQQCPLLHRLCWYVLYTNITSEEKVFASEKVLKHICLLASLNRSAKNRHCSVLSFAEQIFDIQTFYVHYRSNFWDHLEMSLFLKRQTQDRKWSGRPRCTTEQEDTYIGVSSLRNRCLTSTQLAASLNSTRKTPVSTSTMKRRLRDASRQLSQ